MINLAKENKGFNISTFSGVKINGIEQIPDELKDELLQVDDQTFNDLKNHKLMWQNGELVENIDYENYQKEKEINLKIQEKHNRISELKKLLADSDYRAIKYAEGQYTFQEYQPYLLQRKAWRDEINQLEIELNNL